MQTLIVPDIHNKIDKVDKIIQHVDVERIIFLGDYFDDFGDTPLDAERTAYWLKDSLSKPNRVHLVGNHDLAVMIDNPVTWCSGYTKQKSKAINRILNSYHWRQLKYYHKMDGWLLSHAGISAKFVKYFQDNLNKNNIIKFLDHQIKIGLERIKKKESSYFFGAGYCRGGQFPCGGILWCDFNQEFEPIKGVKQIFGHTIIDKPRKKGNSWCLDSHLKHFAIWDGKVLSVYNYNKC